MIFLQNWRPLIESHLPSSLSGLVGSCPVGGVRHVKIHVMLLNLVLKCVKTEYLSPRPTCYHSIHCYLSAILCSNSLLEILKTDSSSMPMFQNSQYTDAHGSTFYDVGRDQINIMNTNNAGAMQRYFCTVVYSISCYMRP